MVVQNNPVNQSKTSIKRIIFKIVLFLLGLVLGVIVLLFAFIYIFFTSATNQKVNEVKVMKKDYEASIVLPSSFQLKSVTDNSQLTFVQLEADYQYTTTGKRGDIYNQLKQVFESNGYTITESTNNESQYNNNAYMIDDNFHAVNSEKHIRVFVSPMPHSTNFNSSSVQTTLDEQISYVIISVEED